MSCDVWSSGEGGGYPGHAAERRGRVQVVMVGNAGTGNSGSAMMPGSAVSRPLTHLAVEERVGGSSRDELNKSAAFVEDRTVLRPSRTLEATSLFP